ncbi:50S ribosomal protein L25 [Coraliomargarita sp. SDUM461004]|uniref:Large ribosomal subunit protein bL25 n=1 Tax=Thalassobacterium sedimentorum TaxID=3041258 RepID=A0ABU1AGB8_9BACT|nr:50S ribosomal protein L25 [Coraliomargarita sp. SDUM461004]MDQ8193732.1 50S ribosomal protein L25 [Coraliomargarita sp. SDUM461004]
MQQYTLKISNRENTGRGVARRLRAEGQIPASLYGQGNARSISVSAVDFRTLNREIGGGAALVELTDEKGDSALCLVQDVQYHAVKSTIDHIDFQEVERGHAFTTKVPVHLIGEEDCVGVRNEGGIIDQNGHEVEIRCRPSKLPDHVNADVSKLAVGGAVHISDLPVLEDVEYLGEPDQVLVSCLAPTVAAGDSDDAASVAADEVPATKVSDADASEGK